MSGRVTIVRSNVPMPAAAAGECIVSFDEFRDWLRRGTVAAHVGRHAEGRLLVHRLESVGRPLPLVLALRAMSRGRVFLEDVRGRTRPIGIRDLSRWIAQISTEPFRVGALLRCIEARVERLDAESPDPNRPSLDLGPSPLYLRTDLSFGISAGGSVGHIAGVLNALDNFTGPPIFLTTDDIPTMKAGIECHHVAPPEAFWSFSELPTLVLNDVFDSEADRVVGDRPLSFVYQRYSVNNVAGLAIARRRRVPFVLEYNGSEIWIHRHWGRPLKHERLSARIERLNLRAADLVVVVSRPMGDEVVASGVEPRRVLVNPNGVDTDRYRPDVDGTVVRRTLDIDARSVVVGFIGTFGPWHGAEVLAQAFVSLIRRCPDLATSIRLLLIGDGVRLPAVRRILSDGGALPLCVFAGLVPQERGPEYLAACDVLVSPHVPNPDGTPFFGSPTKLFEYMAMAKGIVASDLDQIGEVLEHGRTAWLVPPASVESLASGIKQLLDDRPLREALGAAARADALASYTWRQHTRRTIERLQSLA